MIAMGFEETEAQEYIEIVQPSLPDLPLNRQMNPFRLTAEIAPDVSNLSERERQSIVVTDTTPGSVQLEVHGQITGRMQERLLAAVSEDSRPETEERIADYIAGQQARLSPSQRGETFRVPRLCVRYQGELELFDKDLILDATGWDLLGCPLDMEDFRFNDTSKTFEFDVDGSRVVYQYKGEQQFDLNLLPSAWTENDLIRWLNGQLQQQDITYERLLEWTRRCLDMLIVRRRFDLATLVRAKFILVRKLEDKLKACRNAAYENGYQELLFGPEAAVETSYDYAFAYDPNVYPAKWLYSGGNQFKKHFYPRPGELDSHGEEYDCAAALDAQPAVKHWARNLSNQPTASMWLQTSSDRFYPDFVAELNDGRLLMVEYKGRLTEQTRDTDEERLVGEKWESSSDGKALFMIAENRDASGRAVYEQIREKIG